MDIVIKPMDGTMNRVELFAGVAVLGNGELSLIINPKGLFESKDKNNSDTVKIPAYTIPPSNGGAPNPGITH